MNILEKTKELIKESEEMIEQLESYNEPAFAFGIKAVKIDIDNAKKAVENEDATGLLEAINKLEGFLNSC